MGALTAAIGKGLLAGLMGTMAMTFAEEVEMKARGRPPSMIPAELARRAIRVRALEEMDTPSLATVVHWSYGTVSGAARGFLGLAGARGATAAMAHFTLVWSGDMLLLVGLDLVPPPWTWEANELAIHTFHRAVLAFTTSAAYDALRAP